MKTKLLSAGRFLLFLSGAAVFSLGLNSYLFDYEENHCEMTYMFETPEYLEVPLRPSIRKRFPNYRLYLYGEGAYARRSRNMQLSGIPVLFVPGNAGSYKQVRSLASVALRKAESRPTSYHFNFFAVDFDEELAALFGGYLESQSDFVSACIDEILDGTLYRNVPRRAQIVLVGHSVGGLHTRLVASQKRPDSSTDGSSTSNTRPDRVAVVIELATPNNAPVFAFDEKIAAFYERLNADFKKAVKVVHSRVGDILQGPILGAVDRSENGSDVVLSEVTRAPDGHIRQLNFVAHGSAPLASVTFISIGGGARDVLVPSRFTPFLDHSFVYQDNNKRPVLVHVAQYAHSVSVSSSAVQKVWASTDHRCIAWCKQLVMRVVDTLFELVEQKPGAGVNVQIDPDPERRFRVAERYYRTCDSSATRSARLASLLVDLVSSSKPKLEAFDNPNTRFLTRDAARWLFTTSSIQADTIILTPLQLSGESEVATPLAALFNQAHAAVSVYACTVTVDTSASPHCTAGLRIDDALLCDLPPAEWRLGSLVLNSGETLALRNAGFTHAAFRVAPTLEELDIRVERAPARFRVAGGAWSALTAITPPPVANGSVVFNRLEFPSLSSSYLEAYRVEITPKSCRRAQKGLIGTARFVVPHCAADQHTLIWQTEPTDVQVYAPARCLSSAVDIGDDDVAYLDVIVDPECVVELQVQFDIAGFVAQIIRFHASSIFCGLIAGALLGLGDRIPRRILLITNFLFIVLRTFTPILSHVVSVNFLYFVLSVSLAYCVNEVLAAIFGLLVSTLRLLFCLRTKPQVEVDVDISERKAKIRRILSIVPYIACAFLLNSSLSFYLYTLQRLYSLLVCDPSKRKARVFELLLLIYIGALFSPVCIVWLKRLLSLWLGGMFDTLDLQVFSTIPLADDCWKMTVAGTIFAASNVNSLPGPQTVIDNVILFVTSLFAFWCGYVDIPYLIPTVIRWSYVARVIGSFISK